LIRAYLLGEPFTINTFVSPKKQEAIKQVLQQLGDEKLAPVKEQLGENFTYDEIRWVLAALQKQQRVGHT
jgi:ATP-dependent DNA helicase RecQ